MHSSLLTFSLLQLVAFNLSSALPSTVLSFSNWKLFEFSGSNLSDPDYAEFSTTQNQMYEDEPWFYDDDNAVYFKCYVGYSTTSGSGNPPVELRQVRDSDGANVYWDGTSLTTHTMESQVRVDRLPSSGNACVMQIHGTNGFDDVIRVEFKGDAHQQPGIVNMKISGYIMEDLLGSTQILETQFSLRVNHEFVLEMKDSFVTLSANGSVIFTSEEVNSSENYFRADNYL